MKTTEVRVADQVLAKKLGWRPWRWGDPYQLGLKFCISGTNQLLTLTVLAGDGHAGLFPGGYALPSAADLSYGTWYKLSGLFIPLNFWLAPGGKWHERVPAYSSDLNAVQEVALGLTDKQFSRYRIELGIVMSKMPDSGKEQDRRSYMFMSTAAQRVEALNRAIPFYEEKHV